MAERQPYGSYDFDAPADAGLRAVDPVLRFAAEDDAPRALVAAVAFFALDLPAAAPLDLPAADLAAVVREPAADDAFFAATVAVFAVARAPLDDPPVLRVAVAFAAPEPDAFAAVDLAGADFAAADFAAVDFAAVAFDFAAIDFAAADFAAAGFAAADFAAVGLAPVVLAAAGLAAPDFAGVLAAAPERRPVFAAVSAC